MCPAGSLGLQCSMSCGQHFTAVRRDTRPQLSLHQSHCSSAWYTHEQPPHTHPSCSRTFPHPQWPDHSGQTIGPLQEFCVTPMPSTPFQRYNPTLCVTPVSRGWVRGRQRCCSTLDSDTVPRVGSGVRAGGVPLPWESAGNVRGDLGCGCPRGTQAVSG